MYKSQHTEMHSLTKPVESKVASPKRMSLSSAAELKDTEGSRTLYEDFKSLLVKVFCDLKEDTKTEKQRKEETLRRDG